MMNKLRQVTLRYWFLIGAVLLCFVWVTAAAAQDNEPEATAARGSSCGILAYEWNKPVTVQDRGFANSTPPPNNYNWISPVNYAQGTAHFRVEIFNQPEPQSMRLQLCMWQAAADDATDRFALETCGRMSDVEGKPNTVVTWSQPIPDWWQKDGVSLDWYRARYRAGVAVKNQAGQPISSFQGWDWQGEDPNDWYPLSMHFVTRVTPPNVEFAGWDECIGTTALSLQSFTAGNSENQRLNNLLLGLLFTLGAASLFLSWRKLRHPS